LEGAVQHNKSVAIRASFKRLLKSALSDEAPRADDIGPHFNDSRL
jgi:hypothetical protein